jgi:RNA polymerase sigma-70 factor (ECF subfamily)
MEDRADQDRRLVGAALAGDPHAFGELVERYQRMVAGVAWRYGVRRQEIEDVVSDIFVKACENLERYRPSHPFATWLYRVSVNHVIDRARRLRKEQGQRELAEETLVDPAPATPQELERRERAALVRRGLSELAPHYRDVLFLVYVEGLSVAETAHTLGLPTGTVKTRLMRGRQALGARLLRDHPEHFGGSDALP